MGKRFVDDEMDQCEDVSVTIRGDERHKGTKSAKTRKRRALKDHSARVVNVEDDNSRSMYSNSGCANPHKEPSLEDTRKENAAQDGHCDVEHTSTKISRWKHTAQNVIQGPLVLDSKPHVSSESENLHLDQQLPLAVLITRVMGVVRELAASPTLAARAMAALALAVNRYVYVIF